LTRVVEKFITVNKNENRIFANESESVISGDDAIAEGAIEGISM
jgi:hypothetical protein